MHTTVTRTENNYGILQHPQKVLPVFVRAACKDQSLPVYGDDLATGLACAVAWYTENPWWSE